MRPDQLDTPVDGTYRETTRSRSPNNTARCKPLLTFSALGVFKRHALQIQLPGTEPPVDGNSPPHTQKGHPCVNKMLASQMRKNPITPSL